MSEQLTRHQIIDRILVFVRDCYETNDPYELAGAWERNWASATHLEYDPETDSYTMFKEDNPDDLAWMIENGHREEQEVE